MDVILTDKLINHEFIKRQKFSKLDIFLHYLKCTNWRTLEIYMVKNLSLIIFFSLI